MKTLIVDIFYDRYIQLVGFFKKIIKKVQEYLLSARNRKKNLTVIGSLIIMLLILLITKPSYAIFRNDFNFSLIKNVIGDKNTNYYDISLLIYIEDISNVGKYKLTTEVPEIGYNYASYKCQNNSLVEYDNFYKKISIITNKEDICSIYFDAIDYDVGINIMLEEDYNSNIYTISPNIPFYGYFYSHYECEGNSHIIFDSNLHKVNVSSNSADICYVYFKQTESDIEIALFVEENFQTNQYIEKNSIPLDKLYLLNNEKSNCKNTTNKKIDSEINYVDGFIEVTSDELAYCVIYLDLAHDE